MTNEATNAEEGGPPELPGEPGIESPELEARPSTELRTELAELEGRLQEAEARAAEAVARYRELRLATSPELPEELVAGTTLAEVDANIERAQRIVAAVRSRLQPHLPDVLRAGPGQAEPPAAAGNGTAEAPAVPPGAPARSESPAAWSALTPIQRIRAALNERS